MPNLWQHLNTCLQPLHRFLQAFRFINTTVPTRWSPSSNGLRLKKNSGCIFVLQSRKGLDNCRARWLSPLTTPTPYIWPRCPRTSAATWCLHTASVAQSWAPVSDSHLSQLSKPLSCLRHSSSHRERPPRVLPPGSLMFVDRPAGICAEETSRRGFN